MFNEIRLLIGEDPKILVDPLDTAFPERYLNADLSELPFSQEYRDVVGFMIETIQNGTLKVKLYKGDFLLHLKTVPYSAQDHGQAHQASGKKFPDATINDGVPIHRPSHQQLKADSLQLSFGEKATYRR